MYQNRIIYFFVSLTTIISMVYLLMIGYYNVPSLDDYGYIYQAEKNFIESIVLPYMGWQGRFSTFFVNGIFYLIFGRCCNLIFMTMTMLTIGYLCTYVLLNGILKKYNINGSSKMFTCILSILLVNIGAISYLEPSTFYWLCAINYTFSVWMTMLLMYALYFSTRKNYIRWIEIVISSLYISGTAENYTPMVIMVIGLVWLSSLIKESNTTNLTIAFKSHRMEFVSLMILCIGFMFLLFAPGNASRIANNNHDPNLLANFDIFVFSVNTIKSTSILLLRLMSRSLWYIALMPLLIYFGTLLNSHIKKISVKHVIYTLFLLMFFLTIEVAVCVFGTGWYAPLRAYSFLSYLIIAVESYLCIRIGMSIKDSSDKINYCTYIFTCVFCTFLCCVIIKNIYVDVPIVKDYNERVTCRNKIIEIEVEKKRSLPLVVDKCDVVWNANSYSIMRTYINKLLGKEKVLYEPDIILMPSTIETCSKDWKNVGIKRYFEADFDIVANK